MHIAILKFLEIVCPTLVTLCHYLKFKIEVVDDFSPVSMKFASSIILCVQVFSHPIPKSKVDLLYVLLKSLNETADG